MAKLCFVYLIVGLGCQVFGQGQGNGNGNGNGGTPPGQEKKETTLVNRAVLVSRDEDVTKNGKKPEKPHRSGETSPSSGVEDRVKDFQKAREDYLEQSKEIRRQTHEQSKEAREAAREQTKELLNQLKEQQKQLQQEAKERAKDLKKELHPDLGRVIDSGVDEGRER